MNHPRSSTLFIFFFSAAGLMLFGAMLMLSNSPTLADPPAATNTDVPTAAHRAQFFNPYDGRVDPAPGDRVAVWCSTKYRDIDVWGTDEQSNGVYLATFNYDDVLAAGSDGQTLSTGVLGTVTMWVDSAFHFTLVWNGPYNALGHGDFQKAFTCEFLGGSFTPRPTVPKPTSTSLPVVTVTPLPTATPFPTQSLY